MTGNPFDPGYYAEDDLREFGFRSVGSNVRIAKNNTIIGLENISIGDNVRIDGGCALIAPAGGLLEVGSYIHIGGWCYLSAGDGIRLEDFSGLSQGVRIYTRSDDYSGMYMTNPMVPERYTGVSRGPVSLGRHVIVGSGSVIMPNVTLGEGVSIGALSLVRKDLEAWGVYAGNPLKRLKARSKRLLELEVELLMELSDSCAPLGADEARMLPRQ